MYMYDLTWPANQMLNSQSNPHGRRRNNKANGISYQLGNHSHHLTAQQDNNLSACYVYYKSLKSPTLITSTQQLVAHSSNHSPEFTKSCTNSPTSPHYRRPLPQTSWPLAVPLSNNTLHLKSPTVSFGKCQLSH